MSSPGTADRPLIHPITGERMVFRKRSRDTGTKVRAGDVVHALIAQRERIVEVVRPIETRVGAPVAATCYVDNSPPPVVREIAPGIKAIRGEGRPSKHLRRELERIRRAGPG